MRIRTVRGAGDEGIRKDTRWRRKHILSPSEELVKEYLEDPSLEFCTFRGGGTVLIQQEKAACRFPGEVMDSRNFWAGGPAYEYCIDHGHVDPTVLLLFYETIFQNLPGHRGRLGLGSMSLEELTQVIDAARAEARRKIVELEETIG